MNEKNWRLTFAEYTKDRDAIIAKHENPDNWAKLSADPEMSDRERMVRIMMNNDPSIPQNSYICMSYMCEYQTMSQDFVEDAIYVNSGLCMLGCWDKEIMDWVRELYSNNKKVANRDVNILSDVLDAINKKKFINTNPDYHKFLTDKLSNYYELLAKFDKLKAKRVPKNMERQCAYYEATYEAVKRIQSYKIILQDRLDWLSLPTELYSKDFLECYQFKNWTEEKANV